MIVCVCNRLNEERVLSAINTGACCSDEVYARCGVRKNCGRCQETIEEMLDANQDAEGGGVTGGGVIPAEAPGPSPHASLAGDPETIRFLNAVLRNELTAINQYFLHSRMLADWGLSELAHKEYEESIDEMKHADRLIKRILFLGGLPNLQDLGKLMIGENVEDVIKCDLSLEVRSTPDLKMAIPHCENVKDFVSRELFVEILEGEEEHIDWLQTQLRLIEQMGIQNFVQLQTKPNATASS